MIVSNISIRLACSDELKIVQDLNYKLFIQDHEHFKDLNLNWPYEKEGEDYFKGMIDGTKGVCFTAEVDGQIVGYLAGRMFSAGSAYLGKRAELDNMFVEEAFRSRGVGAMLVSEFKKWCKQKGVTKMFVSAFSPNMRAIAFYQKNGFKDYSQNLYQDI